MGSLQEAHLRGSQAPAAGDSGLGQAVGGTALAQGQTAGEGTECQVEVPWVGHQLLGGRVGWAKAGKVGPVRLRQLVLLVYGDDGYAALWAYLQSHKQ